MVYYRTSSELSTAFGPMAGGYNAADLAHQPDSVLALELAALKPGESVLELGTAGGRLIAQAKLTVGTGVCVGVDAVQELLNVDFPHTLSNKGLAVYPQGTAAQQVHRLRANITDAALVDCVRALPGTPQAYDCIFAVHVFTTIPPDQRLQTLRNMRRLLAANGRIIMNMSARFINTPPPAAEAAVPEQFRTAAGYTEAPGSLILMMNAPHVTIPTPLGPRSAKTAVMTNQLSPDRLWVVARQQAAHAAERAGLFVAASRDIGKGDQFGLPRGGRSPPQGQLDSMPVAQIVPMLNERTSALNAYHCSGRAWDTLNRRVTPAGGSLSPAERDFALVLGLQRVEGNEKARIAAEQPAGAPQAMETAQLGVLVSLRLGS